MVYKYLDWLIHLLKILLKGPAQTILTAFTLLIFSTSIFGFIASTSRGKYATSLVCKNIWKYFYEVFKITYFSVDDVVMSDADIRVSDHNFIVGTPETGSTTFAGKP